MTEARPDKLAHRSSDRAATERQAREPQAGVSEGTPCGDGLAHRSPGLAAPWHESAARLAQFLERTGDAEVCLTTLKQLCRRFGDNGYPGFLKLLLIIAASDNADAQRKLADAIALGLRRGDAPSGVLTSWGATRFWSSQTPLRSGMLPGNALGMAPRRQLDPLEYLTVWFSQPTHRRYLGEHTYRDCLNRLIDLFNTSEAARHWYPLKIEADLAGIEGAFTRHSQQRLAALAAAWKQGLPVPTIVAAADPVAADAVPGSRLPPLQPVRSAK